MRPEISMIAQFHGTEPAPRIVSEQTLSQAITSILNNAADASPLRVEVNGAWSDDELVLEIADRGPGMAPEVRARVGASVVTTKGEGLGLGLFLAHTTLQRLGGRVALVPRTGGGTLCHLTLPLAPPARDWAMTTNDERPSLLLVDDDVTFTGVLAQALGARGYAVTVAHSVSGRNRRRRPRVARVCGGGSQDAGSVGS